MSEITIIPQLRFPEFEGEWKVQKMGELGEFIGGGTPSKTEKGYWKGNLPWISSSDLSEDSIHKINISRYITASAIKESATKSVPANSILIVSRVGVGKFAVSKEPICTSQDFTSLIPKKDDSYFLAYLFKAKTKSFLAFNQGTSIKGFTKNDIITFELFIPSLAEQKKIASFLTAIDKRITLLSLQKKQLEQYKKGVMQKIFNQELRFKDENGKEFPEWEENKLGDIGNTYNGLIDKTKVDFGKGKPYIQYKQIFDSSKIDTTKFDLVTISDVENQNKTQYGDIFFTTSSETPEEIGTSSVLLDHIEEVYLNSFCFGFRPNSLDELVPKFAQYFFRSEMVRNEIVKLAQGSTRYNMSKIEFMKICFAFPKKEEQHKISSFLSALDDRIEKITVQIEGTKIFKQGLLQKMFV